MKNKFSKFINLQGKYLTSLLFVLLLGFGQMWGTDYSSLNYNGETSIPSGYKCYGSSTGATCTPAAPSSMSVGVGGASVVCFDVTDNGSGGGSGTYNKRAKEFTVSEDCSVEVELYTGNAGRVFSLYNGSSTAVKTINLESKNTKYVFTYDFTGATALAPKTYSFSGSGSKVYIAKITFTSSAATAPAITAPTTDQSASYTVGDVISALEVTATGSPAPTYQWYYNSSASTEGATSLGSGATNASYTPSNAVESDLYYYCVATNSEGNAQSPYFHVTVNAAVATAPSFTSPASEPAAAEYHVGDAISALEVEAAGYPEPTLQWYSNTTKSTSGATLLTGEEGASYTPSNASESDLYYYCVASNASGDAQSEYFHVTVLAALPPCYSFTPSTDKTDVIAVDEVVTGTTTGTGTMIVFSRTSGKDGIKYSSNGIHLSGGSADKLKVTLGNNLQENSVITFNLVSGGSGARGLKVYMPNGSTELASVGFGSGAASGDEDSFTYTVTTGSNNLIGKNEFVIGRNNTVYLKSITVSNCGEELLALSSAVSVAGKATVTLSKSLVAAGGTATASYSDLDSEYEFDGWEITSGDATIADATAATAAITMGTTASVITLKLKAAEDKHTVTYYDGETELGTEQVVEGQNPTGASLAPRKLGYTFAGWSTTNGGDATELTGITVSADMPLYAVWSAVNCAAQSGTIYTMSIAVAPLANCTITSTTGTHDLYQYEGVSGGEAILGNKGTSNNCILQTNKTILLKDDNSYLKLDFDCPLKEGDKIVYSVSGNNPFVSIATSRPSESAALAVLDRSKTEFVIPAASGLIDAQTIYVWKGGGNTTITSINIYRPAHYAVTFNMHDHGTAIDPQNIVEGGKVTKPTDPTASGWDFNGWYKEDTYDNEWDFANDVVSAATELHAKWTEHVLSDDATLSSLSYTIGGGEPIAIPLVTDQYAYAVELPMGTDIDAPVIAAVANDPNAKEVEIVQTNLGVATVTVTAEDNSTIQSYAITFTVATSKDIELVWATDKQRCDATTPSAKALIATASTYLSASYTGSASEGGSLSTGKTTGSKIIITAKPGYAFKAMGFYGKIEDVTCNFYNDGVVETIGTSNTDACYADVFSNDEVHEFIIELTGTNGVYIRNMQLTMIEACTPITLAWDEEPVEFEVGKAGYAIAATANNSGTVAYSSADGDIIAVNAETGALTVNTLGSVALKAATAEGDGSTYCENGGANIEISKTVNTYYLVEFDAQNETSVSEVKYFSGDAAIALPATPSYSGFEFQGWFDAATGGNPIVWPLTPAASMTVYAQWVAQCAGPSIDVQPTGANYITGRTATALVCEATAGAAGALTYTWYTCDDLEKTNPVVATATPSTAAAGTYYYFCAVQEEGCDVIAKSNVVTITVADKDPICLIATTVTGAAAHGDVTGFLGAERGGEAEVNVTGTSYKMDKGKYIGVTLPDGYLFQEGDKVVINVKTVNQGTGFTLFDSKEGSHNLIIDTRDGNTVAAGANTVVLPAYAGSQSVYVMRENNDATGNLNSALDAIAVYRTSAPILAKVTVAAVEAAPDNTNHVAIEVPFSTTDDALDAIVYDWVSNNDAWTAAHAPAVANTWEWGVENTVTFADKDGDESVYYITISKAVPSSDATLAALTYGTPATAIALADGVYEYNVELPYGTSSVPALAATAHHAGANVTEIDDAEAFVNRQATSTVTVTAEDNTELVYTVNFTVSRYESKLLWDGSTMSAMSDITAAATAAGVSITTTGVGVTSFSAKTCEENGKSYPRALDFGGKTKSDRYFGIEIPAGKVAKVSLVYRAKGTSRSIMVATALSDAVNESTITSKEAVDGSNLYIMTADMFGGGTLYINTTDGYHVHEISIQLADGFARSAMLGAGVYGTICVDHNVNVADIQGVTVYELMGRENTYGKLAFDEIISGELEAGVPYVFQAHRNHMALLYGETSVTEPVDKGNGMYGTFEEVVLTELNDVYYFAQKALWSCDGAIDLTIPANRAYVKLSEIDYLTPAQQAPAPGRRRVTMNVNGEKIATGLDAINASEKPMKIMIDGQIYILRGEKVFDATGRLVK